MFFLRRWIQKYLYKLVKQEEELQEQVTGWHRAIAVVPCVYCAKPIAPDSLFCKHCGFALMTTTQQTTGAQKLPVEKIETIALPKPPRTLRAHVLTNQIEAAINPQDKYPRMDAYNRIIGKKV